MLESLRERLLRRRLYEQIRSELSQHSHRELYDLGISPGDIDGIARAGAYGGEALALAALRRVAPIQPAA